MTKSKEEIYEDHFGVFATRLPQVHYQAVLKAMEAYHSQFPSTQGLKWVKASERKPEDNFQLVVKIVFTASAPQIRIMNGNEFDNLISSNIDLTKVYWLDESAPSQGLREAAYWKEMYELMFKMHQICIDGPPNAYPYAYQAAYKDWQKLLATQTSTPDGSQGFNWTDDLVKKYAEVYRFSSSRTSIEQFKKNPSWVSQKAANENYDAAIGEISGSQVLREALEKIARMTQGRHLQLIHSVATEALKK